MTSKITRLLVPVMVGGLIAISPLAQAKENLEGATALQKVEALANAMGGLEYVLGASSQNISSSIVHFEPEQNHSPDEKAGFVANVRRTLTLDLNGQRNLSHWVHAAIFPAISAAEYTEIINNEHGVVIGKDGFTSPGGSVAMKSIRLGARVKQYDVSSALSLVRRALDSAGELVSLGKRDVNERPNYVISMPGWDQPIILYIDAETHLLTKAQTLEDEPVYGDALWEVLFESWITTGKLKLPYVVRSLQNQHLIAIESRDTISLNVELTDAMFEIPAEIQVPLVPSQFAWGLRSSQYFVRYLAMGVPLDIDQSLPETVNFVEIAQGVFHVLGVLHNSLIIEMKDYLVLVEPVLYEARTQTVLNKIEKRWPEKPIKYTVATHFHEDHIGGVRGYGAIGATVVVGKDTKSHYKKIFKASHTVYPDQYSQNPVAVKIEGVEKDKPYIISDGEREVQLIDIPNRHSTGMLVVYVVDTKLIFTGDLYSNLGPSPLIPRFSYWASDLYDALTESGLMIDTVAVAHGNTVSYEQFLSHVEISR